MIFYEINSSVFEYFYLRLAFGVLSCSILVLKLGPTALLSTTFLLAGTLELLFLGPSGGSFLRVASMEEEDLRSSTTVILTSSGMVVSLGPVLASEGRMREFAFMVMHNVPSCRYASDRN